MPSTTRSAWLLLLSLTTTCLLAPLPMAAVADTPSTEVAEAVGAGEPDPGAEGPHLDIRLRTHANRIAVPTEEAMDVARALLPLAVLATESYCHLGPPTPQADAPSAPARDDDCPSAELHAAYGWIKLTDYPSRAEDGFPMLPVGGRHRGLRFSLYVHDAGPGEPVLLAFAFRGTEFSSWMDWHSNLRWFLPGRDQYQILADHVPLLIDDAKRRAIRRLGRLVPRWEIITTGHSLGGGLAQLMAYKSREVGAAVVFDPSPVTGFHQCVGDDEVHCNVPIWRAYARGEVLAYLRAALRLSYRLSENITEVEVGNLRGNLISRHSMPAFLAELARAYHQAPPGRWSVARLMQAVPDCTCIVTRSAHQRERWADHCQQAWADLMPDTEAPLLGAGDNESARPVRVTSARLP